MDLSGSVILLTGGTGSFGQAFIRTVLAGGQDVTIRVFSRDEYKQSQVREKFDDDRLRFFVGDVRDRWRLMRAAQGAEILVHAAAMKQVPACEYNPSEAIQTNVMGAMNVVEAAIDAGVARVVGLSTDKAVNPVNLYGATKLCSEKVITQGNFYAGRGRTRLSCVRYGNVAGSRGSVLPAFIRQREESRLTITDPRMTRFWITLDQAVEVVLFAMGSMSGGEVFVPKLPSMRVVDLAEAIAPDVRREVVGIRPGEKLHEVLITTDESRHTIDIGSAFVILPEHTYWDAHDHWAGHPRVPDSFYYTSDQNEWWLTSEQLATLTSESSVPGDA